MLYTGVVPEAKKSKMICHKYTTFEIEPNDYFLNTFSTIFTICPQNGLRMWISKFHLLDKKEELKLLFKLTKFSAKSKVNAKMLYHRLSGSLQNGSPDAVCKLENLVRYLFPLSG